MINRLYLNLHIIPYIIPYINPRPISALVPLPLEQTWVFRVDIFFIGYNMEIAI